MRGIKCTVYKTKDVVGYEETYGYVENWNAAKLAFTKLKNVSLFGDVILKIVECVDENLMKKDSFKMDNDIYNSFIKHIENLLTKMEGIIEFLENMGLDHKQSGFDIKMPPTDDFNEFAKIIDTLQKIFNQCPYLNVEGESIKIDSVDIGSVWLKFAVVATSSTVLLSNLATLTDKCVKIRAHYATTKQIEETYRQMKLGNDLLENVVKANEKAYELMIDKSIDELKDEIPNVELKDDDETRLQFAIDNIVKLMDKGMEIYASIDAPPEIKDIFPMEDDMESLVEPIKLLTETTEENE